MTIYKLGEITSYVEGYVNPKISDPKNFSNDGHPWLKVSELEHGKTITKSEFHLSNVVFLKIKNNNQIFKIGTIVWSKSGSVGNASILGMNASANRGILNLIPNEKLILKKYLFYFLILNKDKFSNKAVGAVIKHFYGPNLMQEEIELPSIKEQQKIIDIIEPIENLFIKYPNTINISSYELAKNDVKIIIDIIEPIEKLEFNLSKQINIFKKILKNIYKVNNNSFVKFSSIIKLINSKFEFQNLYCATNSISEFAIDQSKIQKLDKKIPSRASVTPSSNSFIVSKLEGENKIYYFNKKPKEVFSTGFFNFKTNYVDHVSSFLLSDSFIEQKKMYATGTTMKAINNSSLDSILIKKPLDSNIKNELTNTITILIENRNQILKIRNQIIKLLIKP